MSIWKTQIDLHVFFSLGVGDKGRKVNLGGMRIKNDFQNNQWGYMLGEIKKKGRKEGKIICRNAFQGFLVFLFSH